MTQHDPSKKKHHCFPKPDGYRAGSFLYFSLPFSSYPHPISRRDQEDELIEEIARKRNAREQRHEAKHRR